MRLHLAIARELGIAIVSGAHRPGDILQGEVEASQRRKVSRTVYREAVRILAAKGLVSSRTKVGTQVSPRSEWRLLDPDLIGWIFTGDPDAAMLRALFELRAIVEPAAAALAAARRTPAQLEMMQSGLDRMRRHTLQSEEGILADQQFHAALLDATHNPFMLSMANSVTAAITALNRYKQRRKPLERDPTPEHENVFEGIAARDPEAARQAMLELLRLAIADVQPPRQSRRRKPTNP
ncbi:MAG: FadR family transcriptional regulator [Hyphomonadaceae bacterium]|nr:FadR family transcriptional regulator [Hyphomonadaceae bacterium]